MFRILTLAAASALVASGAAAFQSDRYFDQRLDTSVTATNFTADAVATSQTRTPRASTLSTSNKKPKTPYAYTNRFGVGPHNDSR